MVVTPSFTGKLDEEIQHGIPWYKWLKVVADVRDDPAAFGLTKLITDYCQGALCIRHNRQNLVAYETADGFRLCPQCAGVWAARVHFNLPHKMEDL